MAAMPQVDGAEQHSDGVHGGLELRQILGQVVVIGYGNQGRAHAQNLRDTGVAVLVTGRPASGGMTEARADGFDVAPLSDAVQRADLVIIAAPEAAHAALWGQLEGQLSATTVVGFLHGASVHFGVVRRPSGRAFVLVAPKGPGVTLRERFQAGLGIPAMIAVAADAPDADRAREVAVAWATAIGCARAGLIETTFRDEAVADIFGEQAILCGGLAALMEASYDTLVGAGVAPEVAYIECIQELKQIGDLVYTRGIAGMRAAISDTAEAGMAQAERTLPREAIREAMRTLLREVESGAFFRSYLDDAAAGSPALRAAREAQGAKELERVGAAVRTMYFPRSMTQKDAR